MLRSVSRHCSVRKPAFPTTVAHLVVSLHVGGAERLALDILRWGKGRFRGLLQGMYKAPGPMLESAKMAGIAAQTLKFDGKSKLSCILALTKELRNQNVGLLHIHAEYLLPTALPAALLAGIPFILTVHSKHDIEHFPKLYWFMRFVAPFLNTVVCVTEPLKEYYINMLGYHRKKVHVIQNGVGMDIFTPEGDIAALPWENSDELFIFGNVARLHEAKDLATLVRAFSIVHGHHPETRLLLVGDGEERPSLEMLIAALRIKQAVHITGIRNDIPPILRSLDIFVLSSRHEGMPIAILEAMACGVPVISTNVGDIARLNAKNPCITLVPPENTEALAEKMMELMHNDKSRKSMAENSRRCVLQNYSGESAAHAYYALYNKNGIFV